MIWRLLICSSLLLSAAESATVTARVELTGSHVASVRKDRNYSGVVVWLEPVGSTDPIQPRRFVMEQKDKTFRPHVLPIPVGSTVDFPNYDPIFHNAFSNYDGQLFDVGLYPPGSTRAVVFKRAGLVRVFCNIHPTMSAVIVVLNTPFFSVSGSDGTVAIRNVPPGHYRMHVFHERSTDNTLKALEHSVNVGDDDLNLGTLTISETGYVQTPHKNKFGKNYEPVTDPFATYPGAKK